MRVHHGLAAVLVLIGVSSADAQGFDGGYAFAGASYGRSTNFTYSAGLAGVESCGGSSSPWICSGEAPLSGFSGVLGGGYNHQVGSLLIGIEGTGRWGSEAADRNHVGIISYYDPPNFSSFYFSSFTVDYSVRNTASGQISARAGLVLSDVLLFVKVGVGGSLLEQRFAFSPVTIASPNFNAVRQPGSFEKSAYAPEIVIGSGVEKNFGRYFVRGSADLPLTRVPTFPTSFVLYGAPTSPENAGTRSFGGSSAPNLLWTGRATLAAGMRF